MSTVRLETTDGVTTMTLDSPPVNALGRQLVGDIEDALQELKDDGTVRCLVVRSAGEHFCAGADLKERRTMSEDEIKAFVPRLAGVCHGLAALPFPTIAAVRGAAAGGGCELALGCDMRILSDDAKIGLRETALAIIPGAGGTQRLPRLVGRSLAMKMVLAGEPIDAPTALTAGLAAEVTPPDQTIARAIELAGTIVQRAPVAVRLAKEAVLAAEQSSLAAGLAFERRAFAYLFSTDDLQEGIAAFREKRRPHFRGR